MVSAAFSMFVFLLLLSDITGCHSKAFEWLNLNLIKANEGMSVKSESGILKVGN